VSVLVLFVLTLSAQSEFMTDIPYWRAGQAPVIWTRIVEGDAFQSFGVSTRNLDHGNMAG
jgi:hypothetical protein